jgi:titin
VVAPDGSVDAVPTGGTVGQVARAATEVRAEAGQGSSAEGGPAQGERPAEPPRAPTGLAVKRQGDVLTVSWRAPAGPIDHYTVVLNRAVATTTTATSTTLRSPAGRPVRVAVSATNAAGTGPLSTVVTAAAAVARPGAPVGLTLAPGGGADGPRPYAFAPSWRTPDLGGGTLVRYEVSWTSATGARTTKTTTGTSLPPVAGDPCAAPYTVAVRAVTRTPAGKVLTGPSATSSAPAPPGGSCAVRMTVAATADGGDAITVTATDGGGATGPCVLSVDGSVRWSGTCGDRTRTRIPIAGLDPDTTYTVVLTARNPDGSTTRTDPVSVTTD